MPERISNLDAMFLYFDSKVANMQVSTASIVEGIIDYERYVNQVSPRILAIPRLCQIPRFARFHVRPPMWVEVDDFNPADHIEHVVLPNPGTDDQLRGVLSEIFHRSVDLTKPLWRICIVTRLAGGRSAMVFSFHHCLCDGSSAPLVFQALYDPPEAGWPEHVQFKNAESNKSKDPPVPVRLAKALASRETRTKMRHFWRYLKAPAPWFPFTQPVSGRTHFSYRYIPLERFHEIRKQLGGTVTDVGLAAIGGALDRYAAREGIDVANQFFKVLLAQNVRPIEQYGEMGNAVSGIPTLVPLGIAEPAERLARVTAYTRVAKEQRLGWFLHALMIGIMDLVRPMGAAAIGRMMTSPKWLRFTRRLMRSPREHAIVTSVYSPSMAVQTIDGSEVTQVRPMVPCTLSLGLMCAIVSFGDRLQFALSADKETLPKLELLADDIEAVVGEMHACVQSSKMG